MGAPDPGPLSVRLTVTPWKEGDMTDRSAGGTGTVSRSPERCGEQGRQAVEEDLSYPEP